MGLIILLAILAVPLLEIMLFIEVGGLIGALPTVAATVLTAIAGVALFRRQGMAVLAEAQQSLARNRMPLAELFHGIGLLLAGGLLLIPGFLTDAAGLLLFAPPVRLLIVAGLARQALARRAGSGADRRQTHGPIIDGEYHTRPDAADPPSSPPPPPPSLPPGSGPSEPGRREE